MEMHQVRYFLAVCRTLNFTKAAEECNVAQPSLTRAVQKLEEELGGLLFHRERANTHLTELGRAVLPHLEQTYAAAQSAKELASGLRKGELAHLRFGVAESVPSRIFAPVLQGVRENVANLDLTVEGGKSVLLVNEALDGSLDLVAVDRLSNSNLRMRSWILFRESVHLILPDGHPLASRDTIALSDLGGATLIERTECDVCMQFRTACATAGVDVQFRHRASGEAQLQNLVRAGFGLGLSPQSMGALAGLVARPIEGVAIERTVSLAAVAGRRFSPATDIFVKLARTRNWSAT